MAARLWAPRVVLSVADQGLTSGAHFVLSVLLLRWLAPAEYGAYAIAFSVFLFAVGLHHSLILEPMSVVGPSRYSARLPEYLGLLLWLHTGLSLLVAAVLFAAAAAMAVHSSSLSSAMFGLCLSAPGMLMLWLFRRACYIETRAGLAFKGSLLYVLLLVPGFYVLVLTRQVSAFASFLLMGMASVAVSVLLWRRLGVRVQNLFSGCVYRDLIEVTRRHWVYARWSMRTMVTYWLATSIYLPAVGILAGKEEVAGYRAIDNLTLPMSQALTALGVLLLPWISSQQQVRDGRYLGRAAAWISACAALLAGAYVVGVLFFGRNAVEWLYGGDYYARFLPLVPFLGAAVVLRAVGDTAFGTVARAAGRPDIVFWSSLAAAVVSVGVGLPLVAKQGALGAAAGWALSVAVYCVVSMGLFWKHFR